MDNDRLIHSYNVGLKIIKRLKYENKINNN